MGKLQESKGRRRGRLTLARKMDKLQMILYLPAVKLCQRKKERWTLKKPFVTLEHSRVWPYSGTRAALAVFIYVTLTLFGWPSHAIRLTAKVLNAVHTPEGFLLPVCPLPRSLATTNGISFDVSSSPYLDVSVQAVPLLYLWIQYRIPEYELW